VKFYSIEGSLKKVKSPHKYLIKWHDKSLSNIQRAVKDFLKEFWSNDVVFEEFPVVGTRMKLDFYNDTKKIAVEVQGRQHDEYVKHFHRNKTGFWNQLKRDAKKREWCEKNQIQMVEIRDNDILSYKIFKDKGVNL
tara:strand:+ start:12933 stop:13340 length:408 start_codon:yes stop_codon:yes gene_type:complete